MSYDIRHPTLRLKKYFDEFLQKRVFHKNQREKIVNKINELKDDPMPFHKKWFTEIRPPMPVSYHLAEYRLRIGDYRVLYNVDDKQKIVWILDIRIRAEKT